MEPLKSEVGKSSDFISPRSGTSTACIESFIKPCNVLVIFYRCVTWKMSILWEFTLESLLL